ncbi:PfkB family carbohydrate kinase [Catenulispora pinisilvae]|uniref:PfkB family carbohydrate kinase n=1 Tax=Catenulispora pinisilvae TaxID=2705253 RepID=UPI00189192D4|nr:PfkB family carbohydrate kinase [Catenulispora pinisilvae]
MPGLDVIGNISIDHARYPDGRAARLIGGAALHTAAAAHRAGLSAAPVSVIGTDLAHLPEDPRLTGLDWSGVVIADGPSSQFVINYDRSGHVSSLTADYGVADGLTEHGLARIHAHAADAAHVCCRRPLDVAAVLSALAASGRRFSVDFFVSSAKQMIVQAAPFLPEAAAVFVNAVEYALLADAVPSRQLRLVVVSDGARPVRLLRRGRLAAQARPGQVDVVEVTGAGDTLAGTFLAAVAAGADDDVALRAAIAAATGHISAPALVLEDR